MQFEELIFQITDPDAVRVVRANGVVFPIERTVYNNAKEIEWSVPSFQELPRDLRPTIPYWGVMVNDKDELVWKHPLSDIFPPTLFDANDDALISERGRYNEESRMIYYIGGCSFLSSVDWVMVGTNNQTDYEALRSWVPENIRMINIDRFFPLGFTKKQLVNSSFGAVDNFILLSVADEHALKVRAGCWLGQFLNYYSAVLERHVSHPSKLVVKGQQLYCLAGFLVNKLVPDPALAALLHIGIEALAAEKHPGALASFGQSEYYAYLNDLWETDIFRNSAVIASSLHLPEYWDTKNPDL